MGGKSQTPAPRPDPQRLLRWYDKNRRSMPWRAQSGQRPDPYHVWISEIMLQQTTVAAVGPYFRAFITRWPTLKELAAATPDEVLRLWAGLGYYRRARMLHACARQLVAEHGSLLPESEAALRKLPGIGAYTAAAITAIAFDRAANVVDGNVERVMARLFAVQTPLPEAKPVLRDHAASLLPKARHGDYAQALMDLGATVCAPRNPKCPLCPWRQSCRARALGIAGDLPRRLRAGTKPLRRAIAFFLTRKDGSILLRQRAEGGLLGGMMEVPTSRWEDGAMPDIPAVSAQAPVKAAWTLLAGVVRHSFTHFDLEIQVATAAMSGRGGVDRWVAPAALAQEALPSVMRKIIRHAQTSAGGSFR